MMIPIREADEMPAGEQFATLDALKAIVEEVPLDPKLKDSALAQVKRFDEAIVREVPDLPTIKEVLVWFEKNQPYLMDRVRFVIPEVIAREPGVKQIAIGDGNIQLYIGGSIDRSVIFIVSPPRGTSKRKIKSEIRVRPEYEPVFLNRSSEVGFAVQTLKTRQSVGYFGPDGIGKTALWRYLSFYPPSELKDGVIRHRIGSEPVADFLQYVWDQLYVAEHKPSKGEIERDLRGRRALILLDDIELGRRELEACFDALPEFQFVLFFPGATHESKGIVILDGLPMDDCVELVTDTLERELSSEEKKYARLLCSSLKGHPGAIKMVAGMIRSQNVSIGGALTAAAKMVEQVEPESLKVNIFAESRRLCDTFKDELEKAKTTEPMPIENVGGMAALSIALMLKMMVLAVVSAEGFEVLKALELAGGGPVDEDYLKQVSGVKNVRKVLDELSILGLLRTHSPRYTLSPELVRPISETEDLSTYSGRARSYFISLADELEDSPESMLEHMDAVLSVLDDGMRAGDWESSIRLCRAVGSTLALGKRWEAWKQVLTWALEAAEEIHDQQSEAWALHELGTRALCLGETSDAKENLYRALNISESLNDFIGAAVTEHNIDILEGPDLPFNPDFPPPGSWGSPFGGSGPLRGGGPPG
jgi:hypothetical protein